MRKKILSSFLLKTFVIILTISQISSCKKSDDDTNTVTNYPIEGLWVGTYKFDPHIIGNEDYFSFVIKPDGKLIVDTKVSGQQRLALGSWTLSGTTLTCSFTYMYAPAADMGAIQTATATWEKTGKLSGRWTYTSPANGLAGPFTLERIN